MRKPRDYDAELKALDDKARQLKAQRIKQLGELVLACGADMLTHDQLAGALLAASQADAHSKEDWRVRGAAFFQGDRGPPRAAARAKQQGAPADNHGTQPVADAGGASG